VIVTTTNVFTHHVILGPVFAFVEIGAGFISSAPKIESAFDHVASELSAKAKSLGGNAVVGANFSFVDSSLTSLFQTMLLKGGEVTKVFVLGTGTAVLMEVSEQQKAWSEHIETRALREAEERRQAQLQSELSSRGLRADELQEYKGKKFVLAADGRVKLQTAAGWLDFDNLDAMKRYVG